MKKIVYLLCAAVIVCGFISSCGNKPENINPENPVNNEYFVKQNIEIENYAVNFELPENMSLELTYELGEKTGSMYDNWYISSGYWKIINDGEVVGVISVEPFESGYNMSEQLEIYKENPEQNHRTLYYQLPMGSMTLWGIDYKVMYESEDWREGVATSLVYYRSDYMENNGVTDFSHFKEEIIEGDPRINYYSKGLLGYNLDLQTPAFVKMELYYDAITDEEWQHIAETLRITGEMNILKGYEFDIITNTGVPYRTSNGNQQFGRDSTLQMSVDEMIESLDRIGSGLYFRSDDINDLYFNFTFTDNIPVKINDIYCIYYSAGSTEGQRYELDNPMKMPDEPGTYTFVAHLKWNNDVEENIFFRIYIIDGFCEIDPVAPTPVIIYPDSREFARAFGEYFGDINSLDSHGVVQYWDTGTKKIKFETVADEGIGQYVLKINDHAVDIDSFLWFGQIFVMNDIAVITTGVTDIRSIRMYIFDLNGNTLLKVYYLNNKGMVIDSSIAVVGNKIIMRGTRITHGPNLLMSNPYSIFSEYSDYLYHDTVYDDYEDSEVYLGDPEAAAMLNKDEIVSADFELAYLGNGEFNKIYMTGNIQTLAEYLG